MPNVVRFLGAVREARLMCIVMERCTGGDLLERLLREGAAMGEARVAQQIVRPLLATLAALHRLGILHRDVKLENIFLEGGVRLGDFGLSLCLHEEAAVSAVGTLVRARAPPPLPSLQPPRRRRCRKLPTACHAAQKKAARG